MSADLGLATRLRRGGLDVREVNGWKTRANSSGVNAFNPLGGVNHHTAGPSKAAASSLTPSLSIVIHGRSDLAGPLCNVYFGFDNVFYVVAAGPANHAGLPDGGVCRGMHGNSEAWGMEIEHPGTVPLSDKRVALAARAWAAILHGRDVPASQLVQHHEWSPSRKIDLATNMHGSGDPKPSAGAFRGMVAAELERLDKVTKWTVSYLIEERDKDGRRIRKTATTRDRVAWAKNHPAPYQRGRVFFDPIRG